MGRLQPDSTSPSTYDHPPPPPSPLPESDPQPQHPPQSDTINHTTPQQYNPEILQNNYTNTNPQPQPQLYQPPPVKFPPQYMQNEAYPPQPVKFPPPPPMHDEQALQFSAAAMVNAGTMPWTTGLFGCMDDPTNALMTALFPCITFGQIAEIIDGGHTRCGTSCMMYGCIACLVALPCLISCGYRTRLRAKYNLLEVPAPDWLTHFLCECCALCQEYRELRNRGLDPALGWYGNMRNQNMQQGVAMMPPMNQTMMG
ncbi:Protein PLANT CADMIUM RESISTANCE 6 [Acorus calamus]|uniref:Protein PLANT CADMIUM RESISTANCE 6 n=1 Tax=Acorus calamus TaxID=4465 RepID=A0AAV9CLN7_ACOCL|nr:Protein PLANT CADMIUM RESISTANCE 6 [Acorus calamus]